MPPKKPSTKLTKPQLLAMVEQLQKRSAGPDASTTDGDLAPVTAVPVDGCTNGDFFVHGTFDCAEVETCNMILIGGGRIEL